MRADVLAQPRLQAALGQPRLGGADGASRRNGHGPCLSAARAHPSRRPGRARGELLPTARGTGRATHSGADPDRARQRRAAVASDRVLATPRRARGAARTARPGPAGRRPAARPRLRGAAAPFRAAGGPQSAPRPARVRHPDRPGPRASSPARPGRRGRRDFGPRPDRRRAGHGQAPGGADDPPAWPKAAGAARPVRLCGASGRGARARAVRHP